MTTQKRPLKGHTSEETAFVVNDYPYGFKLRCKIRYWLEFHVKHGFRFCSQTTNPKRSGESWNKPKKSTYCSTAAFMYEYFNEERQQWEVTWGGFSGYGELSEGQTFLETYKDFLCKEATANMGMWIAVKAKYEQYKAEKQTKEAA